MNIDEVLSRSPVFDGHNDLLWAAREAVSYDFELLDLSSTEAGRSYGTHTDIPRAREGGLGAQFWSVFVPADLPAQEIVPATLEQINAAHQMMAKYDELSFVQDVAGVERAWARGQIASLLGAEGGHQIHDSLGVLGAYARLGVRYLTLTHNDNVSWADSATDTPVNHGLSDFGRAVVTEMNDLGVMVDLSHVSADVMRQALEITSRPVLFSHSSAREVCDHPRNVPDDVLGRLSTNGGICMVTFVPFFVSQAVRDWQLAAEESARASRISSHQFEAYHAFLNAYGAEHAPPKCTINDVVAHFNHVREVAGIEHVGIGGDYDGVGWQPVGLEDVSGYPRLLEALAESGWSRTDLEALTCRNVLRVLDANPTPAP